MPVELHTRLAIVLCILAAACAPETDFPLPAVIWEGEHVRVRADEVSIPVCGGTFIALDFHARELRRAMGLEGAELAIDYSLVERAEAGSYCRHETAIGCAHPETGEVLASAAFIPHEVVHAARVLDPSIGWRSSPVEEGLATVFGDVLPGSGTIALHAQETLADDDVFGANEYYRSGHLMAFLLRDFGTDGLRDFDRAARDSGENQAFAETFGESKEDFASRAEQQTLCEPLQWWVPLIECSGEPLEPDEDSHLLMAGDLACEDDGVVGPDIYGRVWTSRHFTIDRPTNELAYQVQAPEGATIEIVGCEGTCPDRFAYRGSAIDISSYGKPLGSLPAGDYALRVVRPFVDDGGAFEFGMTLVPE